MVRNSICKAPPMSLVSARSVRKRELIVKSNGIHLCTDTSSELLDRAALVTLYRDGRMEIVSAHESSSPRRPADVDSIQRIVTGVTPSQRKHHTHTNIHWFALDERIVLFDRRYLVGVRRINYLDIVPIELDVSVRSEVTTMKQRGCSIYLLEFTNNYTLLNVGEEDTKGYDTITRALSGESTNKQVGSVKLEFSK